MYERFTDRARKVISLADQERQRSGSAHLTPEHLLMGLMLEGRGVAAHALGRMEPDLQALKAALAANIAADVAAQPPVEAKVAPPPSAWRRIMATLHACMPPGKRPLAADTKCVIEHAMRESRALGHNYVGDEHLLLGLLDEPDSAAVKLLLNHGLKSDDIRREVLDILGPKR